MIVNKKQLAEIFGISERSFTEYQKEPTFPFQAARRGQSNEYDTVLVFDWLKRRENLKQMETAKERLDRVRGSREELALAKDLEEVIPAEETIKAITDAIIASRNVMLHGNTQLKKRVDQLYKIDIDIEILNDYSRQVLTHLSSVGDELAQASERSVEELDPA